jgi:hypothetical protein
MFTAARRVPFQIHSCLSRRRPCPPQPHIRSKVKISPRRLVLCCMKEGRKGKGGWRTSLTRSPWASGFEADEHFWM